MSIYWRDGAALLHCPSCGYQVRVEWKAGDLPLYLDEFYAEHCGAPMLQMTHNDGVTPLSEPCPSYCCPSSAKKQPAPAERPESQADREQGQ